MKDKTTATLLCLFLGAFGAHWIYLEKKYYSITSVLFFWTGIPLITSFITTLIWLSDTRKDWNKRYNPF